ncbi:MAG: hypothetical protein RBS13_02770, partial [Bacteroidales bacterium]|nr:hypothetical protein [Bacteroidales bacterium]
MKTLRKLILILLLVLAYEHYTQAQIASSCPNLNFSQGNFTNWVCKISNSSGVGNTAYSYLTWTGSSPVSGRHTIMTDIYAYDNHTCNGSPNAQLALVPDGFNQSARIGNDYTMNEADAITYQMTVDSNNALLLLHFAVVFNDPSHPAEASPYFELRIQDVNGTLKNIPDNRYLVVTGNNLPGFQYCSLNIQWKDWSTVGINLLPLLGQTIYIVIATADCGYGGHFGYGYAVGECRPMEINVQYCCPATVARLEAPEGFVSYVWRGPNGNIISYNQKVNIQNPADSSIYTVTMTSALGTNTTLSCMIVCDEVDVTIKCDSTTYACYPGGVVLSATATSKISEIS